MSNQYKSGDKVIYLSNTEATICAVEKNGVWIGFYGQGLREGQYVRRRVARRDIRPAE